jgi:hypothetical protein
VVFELLLAQPFQTTPARQRLLQHL